MSLLYATGLTAANTFSFILMFALSLPITVIHLLRALIVRPRRLDAKVIVITGATSGIGEALALYYARTYKSAVTLALTGRNGDALKAVASACEGNGARVVTHQGDVTNKSALSRWLEALDAASPVDLVFANAGVTEATSKTTADLEAAARTIFATNVDGVFNTIFPVLPRMVSRRRGQIVLLSSLASFGALTRSAAYCASKAAVRVYGEALRAEVARDGVRVNVVCPGFVASPMTDANPFPQPFKVGMDECIAHIVSGVDAGLPVIAFPLPAYAAVWALGCMPPLIREAIARARVVPQVAFLKSRGRVADGKAA